MPICTCSHCADVFLQDRLPGEPEKGKRVSYYERKVHRRQERGQAFSGSSDDDSPDDSLEDDQPDYWNDRQSYHREKPSEDDMAHNSLNALLHRIENQLSQLSASNHYQPGSLVFADPPSKAGTSPPRKPNLSEVAPTNTGLIGYKKLLEGHQEALSHLETTCPHEQLLRLVALKHNIALRLHDIRSLVLKEWELQACRIQDSQGKIIVVAPSATRFKDSDPVLLTVYLLTCILHLLCGLSMEQCGFVLHTTRLLISLIQNRGTPEGHPVHAATSSTTTPHIPLDLRTVFKSMNMDPKVTSFVCCPRCFSLYRIDPTNDESYPEWCINKDAPDSDKCNRTLRHFRRDKGVWIPSREMLFRDIKEWIGILYSRPDLEPFLDRTFRPLEENLSLDEEVLDIWDAPALRCFKGMDGQPFLQRPGTEGRLALCLNQDGLNPHGNLIAGKKVTIGAIYLVCLNLPPALHYEIDNMCLVGVIPGPHEPSRHQMNYVLAPVVQTLKVLWIEGIYLTQTSSHVYGRLVRAALVILVCDLLAARQVAGFAQHSHTFFCHLCKLKFDDISNLDFQNWPFRTYEEHTVAAQQWKTATTEAEREDVYNENGLRWSVLMELPYWNSVKATLIDTMHCFFLRMLPHHCREVWGMDIKLEDGDPLSTSKVKALSEAQTMHAVGVLKTGTDQEVEALPIRALKHLCRDAGLPFGGRKKSPLIQYLKALRSEKSWPIPRSDSLLQTSFANLSIDRHPNHGQLSIEAVLQLYHSATKSTLSSQLKGTLVFLATIIWKSRPRDDFEAMTKADLALQINNQRRIDGILDEQYKLNAEDSRKKHKLTAVLGHNMLKEVRGDMNLLSTPTWFDTAPAHPGEARWGKFNAAQWRAFCLVHLPITLIRIWGDKPEGSRERQMLENFMHLVTAINHATARVMTPARIQSYEYHMHNYLKTLIQLYPGTAITPYQHLSLHLGSMLRDYGPTHGWRCFPFERANGRLQRVPTNNRFGELEQTILRRFTNIQNLHLAIHHQFLPPSVHQLIPTFIKTFSADVQGKIAGTNALLFDETFQKVDDHVTWDASEEVLLPLKEYEMFVRHCSAAVGGGSDGSQIPRKVFYRSHIKLAGRRYDASTASKSRWGLQNSLVLFQASGCNDWSAGQISKIFSQRSGRNQEICLTFLVLDIFDPLPSEQEHLDSYRTFPPLGGRLFLSTTSAGQVIVGLDQIISQCATLHRQIDGIDERCIHVIPLL